MARLLQSADVPVVLAIAPAGFGKTTMLAEWREHDPRPFSWLTLDDAYNDPAVLVGSLAAALNDTEPLGDEVFAALAVPHPNITGTVLPRLRRAMSARECEAVIVVDDLDAVREAESLAVLATFIESLPEGLQLVLARRDEPPLRIARLRANGELLEIGARDLAMTQSEASELLRASGLRLDAALTERLLERTEGWAAALHLAILALQDVDDPVTTIEGFAGDERVVADYLRDEILAAMEPEDVDFLTAASVLDRLSGPVCDAVMEREGTAETLRRLVRSNALLIPLDRRDEEYRCHSLLREMLESELHRLGVERERELHRRAAIWFAERADYDRAVPHAISSGDIPLAGGLIWASTPEYEGRGRAVTIRRWLDLFTADQIASSPPLSLARATTYVTRGDGAQVERWTSAALAGAAGLAPEERRAAEAAAGVLRAAGSAREGMLAAGAAAERGYELLPEDSPWRSLCRLVEGVARHLTGDRDAGRELLEDGARRGRVSAPSIQVVCLAQLALLSLDEDDADQAATYARQALDQADRVGLGEYPAMALVFAASALTRAMRGRANEAGRDVRHAVRLLEMLNDMSPWYEAETRITLARALLRLDELAAARAHLDDAVRFLRRTEDATVLGEWLERARGEAAAAVSVEGRWPLTTAELRLLHRLPSHLSFREIADELYLSPNTIKSQAQAIYRKIGASSRAEAVSCAEAVGLLDPKSPLSGDAGPFRRG